MQQAEQNRGNAPDVRNNEQAAAVAAILADAFAEDPCMNWVIPNVGLYPAFYRLLAEKMYLPHNMVYTDTEERAAAMWLPPGASYHIRGGLTQLWLVLRLVASRGPGVLARIQQSQEVMSRHHPSAPHYYLHAIGVRRDSQGRGLGSALIKHVTRRCDSEAMPAYLESSSPANVPLYQRHGFEIQAEEPIGKGGPTLFFMWREPQPQRV